MRNRYGKMLVCTEKIPSEIANLLIDFCSQQMYNIDKSVGKLIYYSIHFIFCQERNKKMDDDDLEAMRQAVIEACQECTDTSMLDLILKLLLTQ